MGAMDVLMRLGGRSASVAGEEAGTGALAALRRLLVRDAERGAAKPITAYHGTPHAFDRFDTTKIGSGEGTAFGHGLYFTETEDVARGYRDALTPPGQKGSMYQVAIKADPERLVDYDAPFGKQTKAVRQALAQLYGVPENQIPKTATARVVGPDEAARAKELGIQGVKYLDANSRGAGAGSRNYVVFDDQLVDILKRYGIGFGVPVGASAPIALQVLANRKENQWA